MNSPDIDLRVRLGRLELANPILVASGTFGYAREMAGLVDLGRLGGILPKTITAQPRAGNTPWRTVETPSGMLNSIGLDNDGIETFIAHHLPYLAGLGTAIVVSIAAHDLDEFVAMAARLDSATGLAAIELNLSCPNVAGGVDFGTDAAMCRRVVAGVRAVCRWPILAKLTPNVTDVAAIARAAADGGADAISVINTCLGMAVDWRRRRPLLGNVLGGLSGPAIKPIALRVVYQVARAVKIPVVGIGGIATVDDVLEFAVAGATAVQIGTANFYDPTASMTVLDRLPKAVAELGSARFADVVGHAQNLTRFLGVALMRVLSGIQPTNRFHWGNYFGAIRQYIDLQGEDEAYYFIANLHALTTVRDAQALAGLTMDAAIDLIALGLDPTRAILFVQSDVPEVSELCWLLMTGAPMGLLERCHAYKDKKAKGLPADAGLFAYPVLMAADILAYDADTVPVGEDQIQHIEVCRDLAASFNHHFSQTFVMPKAKVLDASAKVPGLDGEKMSKSSPQNCLWVFDDPKAERKKIMRIATDSRPMDQPKEPGGDLLFQLYSLVATDEERAAMAELYRRGGFGYGEVKKALADAAERYFGPARARAAPALAADTAAIEKILAAGAARARRKAGATLARAKAACRTGRWQMSRPSERVLLAVVLAAAAAVAIGWVVFLISRAGVAPVVLLPIAVGLAIGLAQAAIFDRLQAPLSWPAAAGLGLLFGALAVVTQDYSGYRDYRAEQAKVEQGDPQAAAAAAAAGDAWQPISFAAYLAALIHRQPLWWPLDALLTPLAAAVTGGMIHRRRKTG